MNNRNSISLLIVVPSWNFRFGLAELIGTCSNGSSIIGALFNKSARFRFTVLGKWLFLDLGFLEEIFLLDLQMIELPYWKLKSLHYIRESRGWVSACERVRSSEDFLWMSLGICFFPLCELMFLFKMMTLFGWDYGRGR